MAYKIIKDREVVDASILWQELEEGAQPSADAHVLVSLARAEAEGLDALRTQAAGVGLLLTGADDAATAVRFFDKVDTIAILFPKFADGRGYSIARLLRERHGWKGELRARGQIIHDQLFYLSRCGFDVLEVQEHKDPSAALGAFEDFSVTYQPATDGNAPVYAHERPWPEQTKG